MSRRSCWYKWIQCYRNKLHFSRNCSTYLWISDSSSVHCFWDFVIRLKTEQDLKFFWFPPPNLWLWFPEVTFSIFSHPFDLESWELKTPLFLTPCKLKLDGAIQTPEKSRRRLIHIPVSAVIWATRNLWRHERPFELQKELRVRRLEISRTRQWL